MLRTSIKLQVAIKKVLQDKRFKNRELQIMRMMDHCNVVQLKHCFYTTTEKDEVFLNLVLEFVPETVYRIGKHYSKNGQRMPTLFVKLYVYQVQQCYAFLFLFVASSVPILQQLSNSSSKVWRTRLSLPTSFLHAIGQPLLLHSWCHICNT